MLQQPYTLCVCLQDELLPEDLQLPSLAAARPHRPADSLSELPALEPVDTNAPAGTFGRHGAGEGALLHVEAGSTAAEVDPCQAITQPQHLDTATWCSPGSPLQICARYTILPGADCISSEFKQNANTPVALPELAGGGCPAWDLTLIS